MGLPSNFSASRSSSWATAWSRNCLILLERPIVTLTGVGTVVTISSWIVGVELAEDTLLMLAEPAPFFGLLGDLTPLLSFRLGPLLKRRFIVQKAFVGLNLMRTDKYNMRLILCSMLIIAYCVLAWWPVAPWPAPTGFASPSASNLRSCDCHQLRGIHLDTVLLRSNHYSTVVAGVLREYFSITAIPGEATFCCASNIYQVGKICQLLHVRYSLQIDTNPVQDLLKAREAPNHLDMGKNSHMESPSSNLVQISLESLMHFSSYSIYELELPTKTNIPSSNITTSHNTIQ